MIALHLSAQCFNMTDLNDPSITCTYGYYNNPYASVGVINGRHTVMTNVNGNDSNIPQLSVVPPGETSSIRLGNDNTGSEAESITFEYTVDPENTILLLKYAAVMEDPNHSAYEQPRLRLEVFDMQNNAIDPACSSFDFVANASLGWNSVNIGYGTVLWKDWTNIGVDLEQYIGETIKIRLTTYDCNQSGHYGYAYIHLGCTSKKIISLACGNIQSTTFQAPTGFEYSWYSMDGGVNQSYGTQQNVTVPMDGKTYYCDISQVGKPNCKFTLSVEAHPRYPIADFSVQQVFSCVDTIYLTNLSGVSRDGINKNNPLEPCDSAVWDLGDGRKFTSYDISSTPITYAKGGEYTITLTSYLTAGGCYDIISKKVTVGGYDDTHDLEIHATTCDNEPYDFYGRSLIKPGTYTHVLTTARGCDSIVTLHLTLNPSYDIEIFDTICDGEVYLWNKVKYTESGSYTQEFETIYGCDSIVTLHLIVGDLYNLEWSDTICDGEVLVWNDSNYVKTGYYTQSFVSRYGCDSIVTLHLTVGELYDVSIYDTICVGETYTWDGVKYTTTGVYPRKYQSRYGCDSLVTLYLTVGEKYDIEMFDTICENEVYVWNKVQYKKSGSYTQQFSSRYGCDSIVTVHLFVAPIVYESYAEAICKDEPYYFGKNILTKPGVYVDTAVSMYGCDSITTLTLRVHEPYLIDQYIEACHNDTFMFRGMLIDEPGIYYDSMLTQHGCDSVYRLIYNKTPTYMFQEEDSICVGSTYNFRGMTLTKPGVYYDSLSTVSGCDSIYKLILHNFSHSDIYSIEVADVCGDNQSLQLVAHYEGQRPEYYNIIYSKEANAQGFKNIIQVPFTTDTIEAPMPNATPYIHPDYYELTLQLGNYKCPKSVSEHTTDFLVRYPSWIIEQNWQDVVAVLNAQHNGGYTFENYEWYVNNQPASQNKSYLYLPTLRVGDEVELHVMRKGEDYYVPTCSIIIEEQDAYNQDHPTLATPAKVSRNNRQVSLEAQAASTQYYLYDIAGRCLLEGVCEYGQVQHFELPTVAGSYFLTMVDAENRKQTIHMVVD